MNHNKTEDLKNGWLLIKLSIFFVFFISHGSFAQDNKSNEDAVTKIKTKASKRFIEENLVGYWIFDKLTTPLGEIIKEIETTLDSLRMTEKISRPDVIFDKNKNYKIVDGKDSVVEKGSWFYDKKDDIIKFIFDESRYNVPIDNISPQLLEELKEKGSLIEFTENYWEIHRITSDELSVIEHLPHTEVELKYNLKVYRKRK